MMVRTSRFLLCFLWFPEGPDPRSARAGAVETPFFTLGLGSKTVVFHTISCTFLVPLASKSVQKTSKIELESNILESLRFFLFRFCFWQPFAHVMDRLFVPLRLCGHQKVKVFLSQKRWTRKKWYPTMSGGHWRFKVIAFSRIGGPRPSRKRQFSMLVAQSHAI